MSVFYGPVISSSANYFPVGVPLPLSDFFLIDPEQPSYPGYFLNIVLGTNPNLVISGAPVTQVAGGSVELFNVVGVAAPNSGPFSDGSITILPNADSSSFLYAFVSYGTYDIYSFGYDISLSILPANYDVIYYNQVGSIEGNQNDIYVFPPQSYSDTPADVVSVVPLRASNPNATLSVIIEPGSITAETADGATLQLTPVQESAIEAGFSALLGPLDVGSNIEVPTGQINASATLYYNTARQDLNFITSGETIDAVVTVQVGDQYGNTFDLPGAVTLVGASNEPSLSDFVNDTLEYMQTTLTTLSNDGYVIYGLGFAASAAAAALSTQPELAPIASELFAAEPLLVDEGYLLQQASPGPPSTDPPPSLPELIPGSQISVPLADAFNTVLGNQFEIDTILGSIQTDSSILYEKVQLSKYADAYNEIGPIEANLTQIGPLIQSNADLLSQLPTLLSEAGISDVPFTTGALQALQVSIGTNGFPASEIQYLQQLGLSANNISNLQAALYDLQITDEPTSLFSSFVLGGNASEDVAHAIDQLDTDLSISCFATGTLITTPSGVRKVENLRPGDQVLSASRHVPVPVRWIGSRHVDCAHHSNPAKVMPVRVGRGTFGARLPSRELWLSPDHAVFVDSVLIPVKHLINGTTIRQVPQARVTYWHVELDMHDVLLAEGMPCESYLDTGGRNMFQNSGLPLRLHPEFAIRTWEAAGCAPLVVTGPDVQRVRALIAARLGSAVRRRHRRRAA